MTIQWKNWWKLWPKWSHVVLWESEFHHRYRHQVVFGPLQLIWTSGPYFPENWLR